MDTEVIVVCVSLSVQYFSIKSFYKYEEKHITDLCTSKYLSGASVIEPQGRKENGTHKVTNEERTAWSEEVGATEPKEKD